MINVNVIEFLEQRRSVRPWMFTKEGPSSEELSRIMKTAMRVPDHKKLAPWRYIVFAGSARTQMGDVMARACLEEDEDPSPERLNTERNRFLRAPVVVGVVSTIFEKPGVPSWEQILSAGACGMNLCLAANALGFGTAWVTEWVAYSPTVREALNLGDHERVAGFIYIGRPTCRQDDRDRPSLEEKVSYWKPPS